METETYGGKKGFKRLVFMIINLSSNPDEIRASLKELSFKDGHEMLLDIVGVCKNIEGLTAISGRSYDPDFQISQRSILAYTDFAAAASTFKIGNTSIRRFNMLGLPLFWLSDLSIKHESTHWGQTFFFLRQLLLDKPELFPKNEKIDIILPQLYNSSISWLRKLCNDILNQDPRIIPAVPENQNLLKSLWIYSKTIKVYVTHFMFGRKNNYMKRAKDIPANEKRNIFISNDQLFIEGKRDSDRFISPIYEKAKKIGTPAYLLPTLHTGVGIENFDWESSDKEYLKALPGLGQILALLVQVFRIRLALRALNKASFSFQNQEVPADILKSELIKASNFSWLIFNLTWLKNYFKHLTEKASIFYTDEFYAHGRMISHAINSSPNKQFTSYGVQHGVFYDRHTVYWIKEEEIDTDEIEKLPGVPLPDHFLVWGSFFKDCFLSKNKLPDSYVLEVGNLNYMNDLKINGRKKQADTPAKLKILWCTTLMPHAIHEYEIISEALLTANISYQLIIRLHPVGHITKDRILPLIDDRIKPHVVFDTHPSLQDSFRANDLILCTGISTSILDSLMAKKHTCKIMPEMIGDDMSELNVIPNLHVIEKAADLTEVLTNLHLSSDKPEEKLDIISYLKEDRWESVLMGN